MVHCFNRVVRLVLVEMVFYGGEVIHFVIAVVVRLVVINHIAHSNAVIVQGALPLRTVLSCISQAP